MAALRNVLAISLAYGFLAATGALIVGGVILDRAMQARVRADALQGPG